MQRHLEAGRSMGDEAQARIRVLGLGNVLMGDDAVGPWVIAELEAGWDLGDGVAVLDVGTPGIDLAPHLSGLVAAIFVDAVHAAASPGEIRLYRKDEVLKVPPGLRISPHDPGLKEALLGLDFAGIGPSEVLLVGVVPANVAHGTELSPEVRAAVPSAVAEVIRELTRLGSSARPRATPLPAAPWWRGSASDPG